MTPSQMRAMRAKQLLNSGRDANEVARELGYTKVSGMLGAISLCSQKIRRDEENVARRIAQEETPAGETSSALRAPSPENSHSRASAPCDSPRSACLLRPQGAAGSGARGEDLSNSQTAKIYPVENGIITMGGTLGSVTIKPENMMVHINVPNRYGTMRWLALYGRPIGRDALVKTLREIGEAALEAAAYIEEEMSDVDHHG